MLRLQTLGSVFVVGETGEPLGGAAAQRRTLALLAALAVAGDGGLSRDKIVGLLWPEAEPERARHSLTQALYAARRALDADDLFIVNAVVRLNRRRITCDVSELEAALDSGDLESAAALYGGPFLDGFFLSGSPEFEHWASLQRARLEARVSEALERLAERAEAEGDQRRAVHWRRRIATLRPLDSGNAVKLMTALAESGDRAGALRHAQVHELLLRDQLGLEPDPAVTALAQKLREPGEPPGAPGGPEAGARPEAGTAAETPAPPETAAPSGDGLSATAPVPPARDAAKGGGRRPLRGPWLRRALAPAGAVLLLAIVAAGLALVRGRRLAPSVTPPLRQSVVVAPFRVAGASASLRYLRDGIVELLSTRLADDTAARTLDAGAVLSAWEAAGFGSGAAVPRDSIVRLAARLGAERVVIGSVVGAPSHLILRASVVAVPSGTVSGEAIVEGPADSISALLDDLAAKLLLSQAGEEERLTSRTTASLPALRAYLAGQAAFRQGNFPAAVRAYEAALQRDPTFALAALRLALAAGRLQDLEQRRRGLALAWTFRDALTERDLALLTASAGPRYPRPAPAAEELAAWRRPAELVPNDPESWSTLGARFLHAGAAAGVPDARARAAVALRRALALDPGHPAARLLLAQLATAPDAPGPDPASPDTGSVSGTDPFAPVLRWRLALAGGDTVALRRARAGLRQLPLPSLRAIALASQFDGAALADAAAALQALQAHGGRRSDRIDLVLAQHSLAVLQGQPRAALEATIRLAALELGSHGYLRLRVLDRLYAEGDSAAAAAAARDLETLAGGGVAAGPAAAGAAGADVRLADLCVLGQWRVLRGDTAGVAAAVEALRRAGGVPRPPLPAGTPPAACAELLDAALAAVAGRPDAAARLDRLDSLALTPETAGDAIAYAPLLIARLYQRVGSREHALQALRKRAYLAGWPRYRASAWREEGRLAELAGDLAGARRAYQRYLALRTAPEPPLAPEVERIRSALAALRDQGDP